MHILGAYVHMCARYEVSVIKPMAREECLQMTTILMIMTMTYDGQLMVA